MKNFIQTVRANLSDPILVVNQGRSSLKKQLKMIIRIARSSIIDKVIAESLLELESG
jgi:hypothetical protein